MSEEVIFYSDERGVRITNTRLIIMRRHGSTTYAMANITSVSEAKIPANRAPGLVVAILGVAALVGSYFLDSDVALICGAIVLGVGILLAVIVRPTYAVRIGSASGETAPIRSKNRQYIHGIVTSMNEAFIKRG